MAPCLHSLSPQVDVTTAEACSLVVALTAEVSMVKAERDGLRLVACGALHHAHEQHLEIVRLQRQLAALRDEIRRFRADSQTAGVAHHPRAAGEVVARSQVPVRDPRATGVYNPKTSSLLQGQTRCDPVKYGISTDSDSVSHGTQRNHPGDIASTTGGDPAISSAFTSETQRAA